MFLRQVKEQQWESFYNQITRYGRNTLLSLQYDIDITCNGVPYRLKVQPTNKRKVAVLQALCLEDYQLIEDNNMLSALFKLVFYQGTEKQGKE